MLYNVGFSLHQ